MMVVNEIIMKKTSLLVKLRLGNPTRTHFEIDVTQIHLDHAGSGLAIPEILLRI